MDLFTLVAKLTMDTSEYEKGITKSKQSFMGLANTVSAKAVAVGTIVAHGVEKAASSLLKFGANAVQASADIEAEIALYHQVFGELESAATGALESISQDTNILSTRLRGIGTSAFMQFKGAGVDAGNAISMMDKYTRLAADAAAAYNISVEEADVKLRSFLRGNTEAGDSIGLFTSESQRNERAVAAYGQKWQKLTEAQKQMLMLNIVDEIYQQQEIIGQAAREGHEWENVIGNLKIAFTELSGTVGGPFREALIPVIEKLTDFLSDETVTLRFGMIASGIGELAGKAFDGAINFIDGLIRWSNGEEPGEGYKIIADIFSAVGNVATAAYNGAKGVVDTLINFGGSKTDALSQAGEFFGDIKTLTESEGFKTIVSVLGGALAIILGLNSPLVLVGGSLALIATNWQDIKDWADDAISSFENFSNLKVPDGFMVDETAIAQTLSDIFSTIGNIAESAFTGLLSVIDALIGLGSSDTGAMEQAGEFFGDLKKLTESEGFKTIVTVLVGALAAVLALNNPIILVGAALAEIVTHWKDIKEWAQKASDAFEDFLNTPEPEGFMAAVVSVMQTIASLGESIKSTWDAFLSSLESGRAQQGIANVQSAMESGGIWAGIKTAAQESWLWNLITGGKSSSTDYDLTIGEHGAGAGFATGLDYVPYNNFFARLHEGEAVLTKAEASQWRSGGSVQSIDYSAIGSAVGSAVREALSGVGVYMGADRVGDLVTERVSRNIARDARNRRYQPV